MFAEIANKALSFISIPVYTRLLTVGDYGIVNVFVSTVGIVSILMTLNTETAISRYYYDATDEEDFKNFVGTSVRLNLSIFVFMGTLLVLFSQYLSNITGLEKLLIFAMIPYSLYYYENSVFIQIFNPMMKSKKIAIVRSISAYLTFGLSVVFMLLIGENKYYGVIIGTIVTILVLSGYIISQIRCYYKRDFNIKHVKYILSFSVPYLPYSLSGVILAQFGRLIIGQQQGFESAGLYSFATNISAIMMILISMTHSSWNPFYFRYMNAKDYHSIDNDYSIIWKGTLLCGVGLSLFGGEIGALLGRPEYLKQLYLIPILVLGYCFYQWAYVFLRNTGYAKRMGWNSFVVIASGALNVVLNAALINKYGCNGVAFSFMVSYLFMLLLSWFINSVFIREYVPSMMQFVIPLLISIPFFAYTMINPTYNNYFVSLAIKIVLLIALILVYIYEWKDKIVQSIKIKRQTND